MRNWLELVEALWKLLHGGIDKGQGWAGGRINCRQWLATEFCMKRRWFELTGIVLFNCPRLTKADKSSGHCRELLHMIKQ